MHIAVVYSKPTRRLLATPYGATDEDSSTIAQMVVKGLEASGYTVSTHEITEDSVEEILSIKAGCIFNLIEWSGLDIALSERAFDYFATLKIPITGSSKELFVLTGDKIRLKEALQKIGVPTPRGAFFTTGDEEIPADLPYPVIVKPSLEHCSVGLTYDSIAHNKEELHRIVQRQIKTFEQSVIAEEFIDGKELLVYLIQEKDDVRVLAIYEMIFDTDHALPFQTYESKWDTSHPDYNSLYYDDAELSDADRQEIERVAVTTFAELGLGGYARFDVRLRDGVPYILEANANPSVYDSPEETVDMDAEFLTGITYPEYLKKIVETARIMQRINFRS